MSLAGCVCRLGHRVLRFDQIVDDGDHLLVQVVTQERLDGGGGRPPLARGARPLLGQTWPVEGQAETAVPVRHLPTARV